MTRTRSFRAMSFILFFLCTIFCTPILALSQSSASQTEAQSADPDPKWALQFQIDENFRMTSFQGSTISLTKRLKSTRRLRFGLSLAGALTVSNSNSKRAGRTDDELDHYINVQLNCLYLINQKGFKRITPYWGIGPDIQYSYQYKRPVEQYNSSGGSSRNKIHFSEAGIGVLGIYGVQIDITENTRFLAEYGSLLVYQFLKESNTTEQNRGDGDYQEMNYIACLIHSISLRTTDNLNGGAFQV